MHDDSAMLLHAAPSRHNAAQSSSIEQWRSTHIPRWRHISMLSAGFLCNCGQESYATEQAAQLAHAVEMNTSSVFADVISRDGPVSISGTYLSVSIVQVRSGLLYGIYHNSVCVRSIWQGYP